MTVTADVASNTHSDEVELFCPRAYSLILIDDDPDQLAHFQAFLQKKGFRVHARNSSKAGMALMKSIYFDLLICDLKMPGLTGIEVVDCVRKYKVNPYLSKLPIIILSSCSGASEVAALGVGADYFCEKRDAAERLIPMIQRLLIETA